MIWVWTKFVRSFCQGLSVNNILKVSWTWRGGFISGNQVIFIIFIMLDTTTTSILTWTSWSSPHYLGLRQHHHHNHHQRLKRLGMLCCTNCWRGEQFWSSRTTKNSQKGEVRSRAKIPPPPHHHNHHHPQMFQLRRRISSPCLCLSSSTSAQEVPPLQGASTKLCIILVLSSSPCLIWSTLHHQQYIML